MGLFSMSGKRKKHGYYGDGNYYAPKQGGLGA